MGDAGPDVNDFFQNFEEEKEEMQREINKLKADIKKMKLLHEREMETKLNEIKDEMQKEFLNQVQQIKVMISQQQLVSTFDMNFGVEVFNKLDGEHQKNIIDKMISKDNTNESINKIGNLLYYLSNEFLRSNIKNENDNFVYFPDDAFTNKKVINKIGISFFMTQILFNNGSLTSISFKNVINCFSHCEIQIKYPSQNFDEINDTVINLKSSMNGKICISPFISGTQTTDKKFRNNTIIESVTLDSTVKTIAGGSFCGSFQGCSSLKYCSLSPTLTSIGGYAFSECSSLKELVIPPTVTRIGNFAFSDCKSLKTIIIPDSVVEIGNCVFNGCSSLTEIFIPRSVTKIGKSAFLNCNSLRKLSIPSSADSNSNLSIPLCTNVNRI